MTGHIDSLRWMKVALLGASTWIAASSGCANESPGYTEADCKEATAGKVFNKRIAPLLAEDQPKSCNQCHLSGIDLAMFVRDTPCETMACLLQTKMVDFDTPDHSRILTFIERATPDSELITDDVIDAEYDGFLDWIEYSALCHESVCEGVTCGAREDAPFCDVVPEPNYKEQDIDANEDCSDLALEQLFIDTLYTARGRCFSCHFEGEKPFEEGGEVAPKWVSTAGNCNQASLATLRNILRAGYINPDDPEQSFILMKPLAESAGGLWHGGHDKFADQEDPAYQNFETFIDAYLECYPDGGPFFPESGPRLPTEEDAPGRMP